MVLNEIDCVKFFTFEHFTKTGMVNHCFSTKVGGISKNQYATLNLGFGKGDNEDCVLENYKIIANKVGFDYKNCVLAKQCHLTNVYNATEEDRGLGILRKTTIEQTDGLVTNVANIVLTTFYADCVPLYFLDPVNKVIASSHSGWQGTLKNIAKATIQEMISKYDCKAKNILVGIGPSIGECCFEVENDVAQQFYKLPQNIKIRDNKNGKYNIDLWLLNKLFMLECGILEENIEVTSVCTKCNEDLFFSHRACGMDRGSMAAFIEIIKE
jgi:polyphenol oxidase